MQIQRASSVLRTDYFRTKPREATLGLYVAYTNTTPDLRIDANSTDIGHAMTARLGCGVHYVVKMNGDVEIGRHPMSIGMFGPHRFHHNHILIGVVGGLDRETGKASTTLVLLPSLSLLSQTMREWAWAANEKFEILSVCSDQSVGRNTDDIATSDASFPVTSDVCEIVSFLGKPVAKVVFCTWVSKQRTRKANLSIERREKLDAIGFIW